jgi:hypothetical protein
VNLTKSPASNQPPSTSTGPPTGRSGAAGTSPPSPPNTGSAYTVARRSVRWEGLRSSRAGTLAPSRCTWKKRTVSSTSGRNRARRVATRNLGEAAWPPTTIR